EDPPWSASKLAPGQRMLGMAEKAATLGRTDWPGFFRAQLDFPEASRLAARLWAESDPAGFWAWLREAKDPVLLDRFATDLARVWAGSDPDAAMSALLQVSDKHRGDELRRAVVDEVLETDLAKGLGLAARAGDFNRFSWGPREWMKADPAAVVEGLAGLPKISDYRHFLNYALPVWIESDSAAALAWMTSHDPLPGDRWVKDGFAAAAKADPEAALAAAEALADPRQREEALLGVVASGRLTVEGLQSVLEVLPLKDRGRAGYEVLKSRPMTTPEALATGAELIALLPACRSTLYAVESLARGWRDVDAAGGWQWATTLPDAATRRRAFTVLAGSRPDAVASLPVSDLSNDLFRDVISRLPDDREDAWIGGLPAAHAAWARQVREKLRAGE
ncbi:hypothetical protein, partial [Luteolibacter marinus]|uniref:hypothetical protein n=1 Tax=Luteolibacter marinus TaxID=2776705 RepID=UPI0018686A90